MVLNANEATVDAQESRHALWAKVRVLYDVTRLTSSQ